MALDGSPEPAISARMRSRPAGAHRAPAAALVACAVAFALGHALNAGEVPFDEADLSPSIAPATWQTVPLTNVLAVATSDAFLADWTIAATAEVHVPNAAQLRIHFADWSLPGDEGVDGAMLRLTSLSDGATQDLGPAQMRAWSGAPAYFNGDSVRIELLVRGSRDLTAAAFARAAYAEALTTSYAVRTVCGSVDDRALEIDPIVARLWPVGCTATIIQDANAGFLTAGHCGPTNGNVLQFNVPLSTINGIAVSPLPADQYPVDISSVQLENAGVGEDWSYFGAFTNATGQTPGQRQGLGAILATATPTVNTPLRISGYGITSLPVSPTWNYALKTHVGPLYEIINTQLRHRVDTTGANSGSAVMLDDGPLGMSRTIVGIHTHAGCSTSATSANTATTVPHPLLQAALAQPTGICASGSAHAEGSGLGHLWLGQDAANNVGILEINAPAGAFAALAKMPGTIQAMAYNPASHQIIAITHVNDVYAISPDSAASTRLGALSIAPIITGLAIVPSTGQWFAVAQATSEFYQINPATLQATRLTAIGAPGVLRLGALDADADPRYLLALDDNASLGTRLIEIDLAAPTPTYRVVGVLGAGATDCNALARTPDSRLITADLTTRRVLEINRQTGAATVLGTLQGTFTGAMGLAWVDAAPCIADFDQSGGVDNVDLATFFALYESGEPGADVDLSGGVDQSDIAVFIHAYESGC